MGSVQPRYVDGRTYEAVETIVGGQLVEARAGGVSNPGAGVAADASLKVLGVAQKDAVAPGAAIRTPSAGVLDLTLAPAEFTVYADVFVPVTYLLSTAYGIRVCAATGGKVRPWITGTDPVASIIGWCAEAAGVGVNGVGLVKLAI